MNDDLEASIGLAASTVVLGVLLWMFVTCCGGAMQGVREVFQSVEIPIERGLAYVAIAILVHVFFHSGSRGLTVTTTTTTSGED